MPAVKLTKLEACQYVCLMTIALMIEGISQGIIFVCNDAWLHCYDAVKALLKRCTP